MARTEMNLGNITVIDGDTTVVFEEVTATVDDGFVSVITQGDDGVVVDSVGYDEIEPEVWADPVGQAVTLDDAEAAQGNDGRRGKTFYRFESVQVTHQIKVSEFELGDEVAYPITGAYTIREQVLEQFMEIAAEQIES